MRLRYFLPILFSGLIWAIGAEAQTVLSYGPHPVELSEFRRAYQRNNTDTLSNREAPLRAYLDLFVKAKMKVREAYARRYDTLPGIVQEVENLRTQLIDKYMADPALLERMKAEAFQRSQTDREVAHIFISFRNPNRELDSARANNRKAEVEKKFGQGIDFFTLAKDYSDDPSAARNQGQLGYITAFTLPYEMESAIYQTSVGKTSTWVRSNMGLHLFRVLRERPAVGTIQAKQILLAIPPGADDETKKRIAFVADSLYQALKKGADFGELARQYSNDYVSAANGGALGEFGIGQYDPVFEQTILSLQKDNDVSAPFNTSYGWHIVQRVSILKPSTDPNAPEVQQALDQKIRSDDRWRQAKDFIYELVRSKADARRVTYAEDALWQYTDSLLDRKPMTAKAKSIQNNTALFTVGKNPSKKVFTAANWIEYATNFRYQPDGTGFKPAVQVRNEWEQYLMIEYYRNNLESFNQEYRDQLTELRDGNLFFEIMQREVWDKAQADTAGQRKLFNQQPGKYNWKPSAEVVLFFCSDINAARELHAKIQAKPSNWKNESLSYGERVFFDSARMEWEQIPNGQGRTLTAGQLLDPVINQTDNNATFAYILRVFPQPGPKSFEEARGSVISDLQTELEKNWEQVLRQKYPVKVNQKVLATLFQ